MEKTRILVIDDESSIIKFLKVNLERNGFDVFTAMNGQAGLEMFESRSPDLVILDIIMPDMDGFSVCRRIREISGIPVIMLSARNDAADKVRCFELGADDYVTKPFRAAELLARVQAVIRRRILAGLSSPLPLRFGDLSFDISLQKATFAGKDIELTPTESKLLRVLIDDAGQMVTCTDLLRIVWGENHIDETQYLHSFINRLRKKLEPDPSNPVFIISIPETGYRFFHR